ncbi:hypothetical protein BJX66DRAFT_150560 [Aspergillus keveii]|uniref:Uncharacterized protein n=1 Tax=Aspergillus keveii TaxID=714993 RepID=A0ABR4GN99_9EURO
MELDAVLSISRSALPSLHQKKPKSLERRKPDLKRSEVQLQTHKPSHRDSPTHTSPQNPGNRPCSKWSSESRRTTNHLPTEAVASFCTLHHHTAARLTPPLPLDRRICSGNT